MTKAAKRSDGPRLPPRRRTPEEQRAVVAAAGDDEPRRQTYRLKWSPKCGDCWYSRCGRYMIHHNPARDARGYHLSERQPEGDGLWSLWRSDDHAGKHSRLRDAKDAAEDLAEGVADA